MGEEPQQPLTPSESEPAVPDAAGHVYPVSELRSRVSVLEPRIVLMREIDMGTPETLQAMSARIEEIAESYDAYGIVLDLTDVTGATTAEYRRYIPKHFLDMHTRSRGRLKLVAVAFFGNPVARVATKFLVARMSAVPFTIEKNRAMAVEAVRKALA
jgi:hypothetical protein